jgi:hypothetical protein
VKTLSIAIASLTLLGAASSAFAGPDFIAIGQARKAQQMARAANADARTTEPGKAQCQQRLILPLDHGPRAVTTPYLNELRKARFEAQQKACVAGLG